MFGLEIANTRPGQIDVDKKKVEIPLSRAILHEGALDNFRLGYGLNLPSYPISKSRSIPLSGSSHYLNRTTSLSKTSIYLLNLTAAREWSIDVYKYEPTQTSAQELSFLLLFLRSSGPSLKVSIKQLHTQICNVAVLYF